MAGEFTVGKRVALQAIVLRSFVHAKDLSVEVTWGAGVKRRITVGADNVRDADMTNLTVGQEITLEGQVEHTLAHHNGVTGVTVSFGNGMERRLVVPESILEPAQGSEIATARRL